jgi:hypothetical protein
MRATALFIGLFASIFIAACDLRSGTAKEEIEKFEGPAKPSPSVTVKPTEEPIDPADVVQVDPARRGKELTVDGSANKRSLKCSDLNPVSVNGNQHEVAITGPCSELTINGDNNTIKVDAATKITFNGEHNTVQYGRYANGKRPFVTDNGDDNSVLKVPSGPAKNNPSETQRTK